MTAFRQSTVTHKHCVVCGRSFEWRKKWARNWSSIAHCSRQCRSRGTGQLDAALEHYILAFLLKHKQLSSPTLFEGCRIKFGNISRERIKAAARRLASATSKSCASPRSPSRLPAASTSFNVNIVAYIGSRLTMPCSAYTCRCQAFTGVNSVFLDVRHIYNRTR